MPNITKGLTFLGDKLRDDSRKTNSKIFLAQAIEEVDKARKMKQEHEITMPKFTIDSKLSIEKYLKELGVKAAFQDGEFKKIVDEPLKLSAIKHRAILEVNKDGTVGAAASAIEVVSFQASFDVPKEIVIDKPFMFFIRDTEQKFLLFAGKFTNPS